MTKNTPERRRILDEISKPDPSEKLEHLLVEVSLGVPKSESRYIETPEDARLWDALARDVADIKRRGHMVVFSVDEDAGD